MFHALEINKNIFIATELRQKNKKFPVLKKKQKQINNADLPDN